MDPINFILEEIRERSAMTLGRVEQNDPDLKSLDMSEAHYWPNDSAELSRLGDVIGRNTHLQRLNIRRPHPDDIVLTCSLTTEHFSRDSNAMLP